MECCLASLYHPRTKRVQKSSEFTLKQSLSPKLNPNSNPMQLCSSLLRYPSCMTIYCPVMHKVPKQLVFDSTQLPLKSHQIRLPNHIKNASSLNFNCPVWSAKLMSCISVVPSWDFAVLA